MRSINICNRESGWGLLPQKILGIIEESVWHGVRSSERSRESCGEQNLIFKWTLGAKISFFAFSESAWEQTFISCRSREPWGEDVLFLAFLAALGGESFFCIQSNHSFHSTLFTTLCFSPKISTSWHYLFLLPYLVSWHRQTLYLSKKYATAVFEAKKLRKKRTIPDIW